MNYTFLLLVIALGLSAQDPFFVHIQNDKKLPSNTIYHLFQDSTGFIWVAHDQGLSRYDGFEFKTYTCPDQTSKAGSHIQQDGYGRVWYQNFDGYVYYVQNDTMKALQLSSTAGYQHYCLVKDRLFVRQKNKVSIYDLKSLDLLRSIPVKDDSVTYVFSAADRYYLIGGRMLEYDSEGRLKSSFPVNQQHGSALTRGGDIILYDAYNRNKDVVIYRQGKAKKLMSLSFEQFIQSAAYAGNAYWFCTPAGARAFDASGEPLNKGMPFFEGSSISSVLNDKEGNYWFGTMGDGIYLVPSLETKVLFGSLSARTLFAGRRKLLIGTDKGSILSLNNDMEEASKLYQDDYTNDIRTLYVDSVTQKIFTGSSFFAALSESGKVDFRTIMSIKDCRRINGKYFAFASTGIAGVFCVDTLRADEWDASFRYSLNKEGLFCKVALDGIRAKSVAYFETAKKLLYATNTGLFAQSIHQPPYELLYRGRKLYLARLQQYGDRVFALSTHGNLYEMNADEDLREIEVGYGGQEAMKDIRITGQYLFFYGPNELLYADLKEASLAFRQAGLHLGDRQIRSLEIFAGKLMVALDHGIVVCDWPPKQAGVEQARLVLNSFKINNLPRQLDSRQVFAHSENNVEIHFSLLHFKPGGNCPLYYRINSDSWKLLPSESRVLRLAALSSGEYRINFRVGDPSVSAPADTHLEFTIDKPWWLKSWMMAAYVIASAFVLLAVYRWQTSILRKQNQLLDQKVKLEVDLRKSMIKSIKAQMNPHFFYNALNTIQSFIYSEDKKNASVYLTKFSKLTRQILEMSEKESVSLHEEIETLQLYLEIEAARFDGDFEFGILVPQEIKPELIHLPPMLIQPYVENAMKHGLLHKKGQKRLQITMALSGSGLLVTIDDNGIGRNQSAEINARRAGRHRSFSTGANEARFRMMEKEHAVARTEIIDKKDAFNAPAGTLVKLTIPISLTQKQA